jgi:hypothetical protein
MIGSLSQQTAGEPYDPYQEMAQTLLAEEGGNLKELIPEMIHTITSPPYD